MPEEDAGMADVRLGIAVPEFILLAF